MIRVYSVMYEFSSDRFLFYLTDFHFFIVRIIFLDHRDHDHDDKPPFAIIYCFFPFQK